jgi:hypothetical protein
LLTFIIVGGGPTGVELAGAIAELARQTLETEFRRVDPASLKLILVEAGPRILPAFAERLAAAATTKLLKLGVEVRTGAPVEKVDAEGVIVRGEGVRTSNVFWAAGVRGSPAAKWLGAVADRAGRVRPLPASAPPRSAKRSLGSAGWPPPALPTRLYERRHDGEMTADRGQVSLVEILEWWRRGFLLQPACNQATDVPTLLYRDLGDARKRSPALLAIKDICI